MDEKRVKLFRQKNIFQKKKKSGLFYCIYYDFENDANKKKFISISSQK